MESIQSKTGQGRVADAPSDHWVYRVLSRALWPYAQLSRWDRPIGWWLLLWPCWWSTAMAHATLENGLSVSHLVTSLWYCLLFLIGAVAMRGAGCTYNDLVDHKIDEQVERTRSRPLPSGQVSRSQAKLFLVAQGLVGFIVLIQFNWAAVFLGVASLAVVAIYPFMKRVTDWPQLFLGLAFSWGALMGWTAIFGSLAVAPVVLYIGCILWTIGYDTIYAHQDKEDDALIGVRSTARLFGEKTKPALVTLYGAMIALFAVAFFVAELSWPAYLGLIGAAIHFGWQIRILNIDDSDQCLALFKSNSAVGWKILSGLLLATIV